MTNRNRATAPARIWGRATKALGKLWAGVVSLPERPQNQRSDWDYPHFPPF